MSFGKSWLSRVSEIGAGRMSISADNGHAAAKQDGIDPETMRHALTDFVRPIVQAP